MFEPTHLASFQTNGEHIASIGDLDDALPDKPVDSYLVVVDADSVGTDPDVHGLALVVLETLMPNVSLFLVYIRKTYLGREESDAVHAELFASIQVVKFGLLSCLPSEIAYCIDGTLR